MSTYSDYATDQDLESGKGHTFAIGSNGAQITIHRVGGSNIKLTKVMSAKMAPYRRQIENGTMDEDLAQKILIECYAEAVVIGWKGVTGPDGKTIRCTKENVIKVLSDLPELFSEIDKEAKNIANFRRQEIKEDEKN